jgi:hypothetical protein
LLECGPQSGTADIELFAEFTFAGNPLDPQAIAQRRAQDFRRLFGERRTMDGKTHGGRDWSGNLTASHRPASVTMQRGTCDL